MDARGTRQGAGVGLEDDRELSHVRDAGHRPAEGLNVAEAGIRGAARGFGISRIGPELGHTRPRPSLKEGPGWSTLTAPSTAWISAYSSSERLHRCCISAFNK